MISKKETLRKLGVILDDCEECGKTFDVRKVGLHNITAFDPEHGEPIDDDSGFFCSEECGRKSEARRREDGEHVAYNYGKLP